MLAFLDIETTGHGDETGIENESILEVSAIITDTDLEIVDSTTVLVKPVGNPLPGFDFTKMDPVVVAMHTVNGLFDEILANGLRRCEAEEALISVLKPYTEGGGKLIPVGNSVGVFDMAFIKCHMPKLAKLFDRRSIDLSSLNQLALKYNPEVFENRPKANGRHRSYDDCLAAIQLLNYYRDNRLFPEPQYD